MTDFHSSITTEADLAGIRDLIDSPRKIAILTHARPDGDAMGSSLGFAHYLASKGHLPTVVVPNAYADFLRWLPGQALVIDFAGQPAAGAKAVAEAEVIFCLDFNDPRRVEGLQKNLVAAREKVPTVMIDHHREPQAFTDFRYWDTGASSTAELIYLLLAELGETDYLSREAAECLYTGVLTDTGGFRHASTTPRTHEVTAKLLTWGFDPSVIYDAIYNQFSEDRMRFFGYCLNEKMESFPEYQTGLISVTREELQRFRVKTGYTEGLVNYPLSITGIRFAALIIDRTGVRKLSLRSKGDIDVSRFAAEHFNGGGHKNASGGMSNDTLEETVTRFKSLLPSFADLHSESAVQSASSKPTS